jgi:pimeloyl-ACP methyl ester carboxylesterase
MSQDATSVVLVHGGFVDGSGWQRVYDLLSRDGYRVSIVQSPACSLAGDVEATRRILDAQNGPVVLVGHSYGGAVISEAGTHDKVAALVYIAAFVPDKGESVNTLITDPPPGAPMPPTLPPRNGFLMLDRQKFAEFFAGDLPASLAAFMADSQVPWGTDALVGAVTKPAWRAKPTWYLVATDDRMIPPPAQRAMAARAGSTTVETPGTHAVYISQPAAVAELIKKAAKSRTLAEGNPPQANTHLPPGATKPMVESSPEGNVDTKSYLDVQLIREETDMNDKPNNREPTNSDNSNKLQEDTMHDEVQLTARTSKHRRGTMRIAHRTL